MRNLPASIRQRLLDLSKRQRRPFQEVLQFYVMERFLYRLSRSEHANRFVLKGALMLQVWDAPQARPTMDIDMLGRTSNEPATLLVQFGEILANKPIDDGIDFNLDSLKVEAITEEADYEGARLRVDASLAGARSRLQLDIGFGDVVLPAPERMPYPVLLDMPAPEPLCYSRESAIAEKFQAMVSLGTLNSRMKDFYDVWLLPRQFTFELAPLRAAIVATFQQRGTMLSPSILFDEGFALDKQAQWLAFSRRLGKVTLESDFAQVLAALGEFLGAVVEMKGADDDYHWPAGGPWRARGSSPAQPLE